MTDPRDRKGETEWLVEEDEASRKDAEARGRLATDVAQGLERVLKSFRQFGARHKTSQGFLAEAHKRLGTFHATHGELRLGVVGADLLYDGQSIYTDPELRTSYPFLLFRDGIHRVVFEPGIEVDEVRVLCQLLRDQSVLGAQVQMEDDLVTLLWDADLAHVRYVVSESFKQDEEGDQEREAQRKRLIKQLETDAFSPALDEGLAARFVRPPKPDERARAERDLATAKAWERGNAIAHDEQARAALAAQVDNDETLLRKFLEIVFVEILEQKDEKVRRELVTLVRDFATEAARRDRLAEAIGVLKALGDLARMAGDEGRKVAQQILGAIATPELLAELMHQLELADEAGTEPLLTFLALVPAKEARAMVPLLGAVTTVPRRRAVCQLLAERLGDDLTAIGEQVRDAEEGLALDLVFLLRQAPSERGRVELLVALDHPSSMVRRAAFDAIRKGGTGHDSTLVGAALLSLDEADPDLRQLALLSLPRRLDPEVAKRLRHVIGRDAFDAWDYSDKRRAFLVYATAAGRRAAKELQEVVTTRAMFSSDALDDRRCAAAFALASLGDEAALATLEAEAKRMFGGKRVKEACESAISLLKFKRPLEDAAADKLAASRLAVEEEAALPTAHLPKPIWTDDGRAP